MRIQNGGPQSTSVNGCLLVGMTAFQPFVNWPFGITSKDGLSTVMDVAIIENIVKVMTESYIPKVFPALNNLASP